MSFAQWPATVPAPERDGLRRAPSADTGARRRLQSGRVEARRFGAAPPDRIEAQIRIGEADWPDLAVFYESDCRMGETWFAAGWIQALGYPPGHVGRFAGYPRLGFRKGVRVAEVSILIQHQDRVNAWT